MSKVQLGRVRTPSHRTRADTSRQRPFVIRITKGIFVPDVSRVWSGPFVRWLSTCRRARQRSAFDALVFSRGKGEPSFRVQCPGEWCAVAMSSRLSCTCEVSATLGRLFPLRFCDEGCSSANGLVFFLAAGVTAATCGNVAESGALQVPRGDNSEGHAVDRGGVADRVAVHDNPDATDDAGPFARNGRTGRTSSAQRRAPALTAIEWAMMMPPRSCSVSNLITTMTFLEQL